MSNHLGCLRGCGLIRTKAVGAAGSVLARMAETLAVWASLVLLVERGHTSGQAGDPIFEPSGGLMPSRCCPRRALQSNDPCLLNSRSRLLPPALLPLSRAPAKKLAARQPQPTAVGPQGRCVSACSTPRPVSSAPVVAYTSGCSRTGDGPPFFTTPSGVYAGWKPPPDFESNQASSPDRKRTRLETDRSGSSRPSPRHPTRLNRLATVLVDSDDP